MHHEGRGSGDMMVETVSTAAVNDSFRLLRDDIGLPGEPTPPANEVERAILGLFMEVLEIDGLGVDDDFFAAQGDSVMAATLCSLVERDFGTVFAASSLLSDGTPRRLAAAVRAARRQAGSDILMPIQRGSGPPVFVVHGLAGESMRTKDLARRLVGRPVYAIRAVGLADGEEPLGSVSAMADAYLEAVRTVHGEGPVVLAGYCAGGMVAYEMARKLRAERKPVPACAIIDPVHGMKLAPWLHRKSLMSRLRFWRRKPGLTPHREGTLAQHLARGGERRQRVFDTFVQSLQAFVPQPYDGDVLIIHCERRAATLLDDKRGWGRYIRGKLDAVCVSKDHRALMNEEIDRVALALRDHLDAKLGPAAGATA